MADLLSLQRIEVATERDRVVLKIANFDATFDYETALKLSQWLRVRAKEAKRNAGDMSRHWSAIGILDGLSK
jgi:hypothetical protein